MSNKIYLIPTPLADDTQLQVLPPGVIEVVKNLKVFLVENLKTARRFISSLKLGMVIDDLEFHLLTKDSDYEETLALLMDLNTDIGVLSEAGCPGVADPGAMAVDIAHQLQREVVPLVGPSSILLALMASGFNGQSFAFNGYLPIDRKERIKKLKELERLALTSGQTQLFMETPYRNQQLFALVLEVIGVHTKFTVSANLTAPDAYSKTYSVEKWRKVTAPSIHKVPAIFGFGK